MLLTAKRHAANTYPVEVSGWDSLHSFFVEKCELEWGENSGKCLSLSHVLSAGSMIFVRLLLPTSPDRSLPVAYRAYPIGRSPDGHHRHRLDQMQPQSSSRNRQK